MNPPLHDLTPAAPAPLPANRFAAADDALREIAALAAAITGGPHGGTLTVVTPTAGHTAIEFSPAGDIEPLRRVGPSIAAIANDLVLEARRRKAALSRW